MSLKEDIKADLSVFYNADEFAKKCIYKGKEVAVLYRKNDLEMFEVNFESIKARKVDFEGLEEGDVLEIEGVSYTVMNFSPEKDFQISISIKEK
ncbi:head-tail joining protein [Aliarcobacter butzleri]|uniref:head-tail joining protein n=1 Tax=Aliarcobacter butzleri TaxID=28197 RepID=UPI00345078AA